MDQEASQHTTHDPRSVWPHAGSIRFSQVSFRYRTGLPLVLKKLDFSICPREKIGIVGRTGSGKSSILIAMLRIVELEEGCIFIDDVDISSIGLKSLRSKIAVISQVEFTYVNQ